jgi:multicomponent Na+:H+ antiporter subunit F
MSTAFFGAALFLLLNLVAGLVRIYLGPRSADRMLALLLFGTTTVAMLLLVTYAGGPAAMVEVALVFVMLAAIGSIAFVALPASMDQNARQEHGRAGEREPHT